MEAETRQKIEEMVLDILKKSDMEEATEFSIRLAASERLGIDLSDPASKLFVRTIVDSYLLSLASPHHSKAKDHNSLHHSPQQEPKEEDRKFLQEVQEMMMQNKKQGSDRIICQLSHRRNVMVQNFRGTKLVSLREFYFKDGKQVPGFKGISLNTEQWSAFKKSVPVIEEAITKMEGRIKSELHGKRSGDMASPAIVDVLQGKQSGDASNPAIVDVLHCKQSGDVSSPVIVDVLRGKQSVDVSNPTTVDALHGKQSGDASSLAIVDVLRGKQSGDASNPTTVDALHGKQSGDASSLAIVDMLHGKQSGDASSPAIVNMLHGKQSGDVSNPATVDALHGKQSGNASSPAIVDVLHGKQSGDASKSATLEVLHGKQSGDGSNSAAVDVFHGKQSGDARNPTTVDVLHGKQIGDALNSVIVDIPSLEHVPIEIIRFDGKNYQFWVHQMESLLKQLKIGYVLTELCPNATLGRDATPEEIAAAEAAQKRWVKDDLMCRHNILNHLCDHLFNQYVNRKLSAKELWDKLRQVYLEEKLANKRLQVKKYVEFQMVDDKTVVEQVRELNNIADSIVAAGMHLDDNFHVSVIISKLPPSWQAFCSKLMREEYLSFMKLMEYIQKEEESCTGVKQLDEHSHSIGCHGHKGGPREFDNRSPRNMYMSKSEINAKNIPCSICGKRGHLSKYCWRKHDRQANERKAEQAMHMPTES